MNLRNNAKRRGFTLVEVLIVVVILGILAATVLPQFTRADSDAKETALKQNLQTFRSQIELYKFQHNSKYPADGSTLGSVFRDSLILASDPDGTTGPVGTKPLGPYFIKDVPPNSYNGKRDVKVVATDILPAADDTTGWIYSSKSGRIKANSTGTQASGGGKLEDL
ncbi:MAG: type II secretion system protein [Planctomycetes bacterium]|nr:type II secretion system protein [Planctomycetota bacterium]